MRLQGSKFFTSSLIKQKLFPFRLDLPSKYNLKFFTTLRTHTINSNPGLRGTHENNNVLGINQHIVNSSFVYSVPVTYPEVGKGETAVYRNPKSINQLSMHIKRLPHIKTLQELHQYNAQEFSQEKCFGTRVQKSDGSMGPYEFKTFKTVYETARKAGSAMINLDMVPLVRHEGYPDYRPIAIYDKNCEHWATLDIAACLYGISVIPIFDVLGTEALQHIFNQTDVTTIFTSGPNIDSLLRDGKEGKLHKLNTIVCLKGYTSSQKEAAKGCNFRLMSWEEFLAQGEKTVPYPHVTSDTVFSLCYTSGTTGVPKGAILTHGNMISAIAGCEEEDGLLMSRIGRGDVHISYLPIAHIFERVFIHMVLCRGVTVGFFSGDILRLSEDLKLLQPTYMICIPRLYNKFYTGFIRSLKMLPQTKDLMNDPLNSPLDVIKKLPSQILEQMKMATGGKVRNYYAGSAPTSPNVLKFLRVALSAPIMEGFGQTETCSAIFLQKPEDSDVGNIGGPFTNLEFKLVDVPEMNYTSKDKGSNGVVMPRGELCLRGGPIFKGYYREPENTAEAIDEDGWYHTGDVVTLLPNGAVKIIDRRKNIFKLAQGKFIAPEKIENIFLTNKYVAEVFVHGDSFQSEIVAIVVPDRDALLVLGKELGLGEKSFEDLCKDPKVIAHVTQALLQTGREAKLVGYELASQIYLEPVSFTLLRLTTPSMKLKRNPARQHYDTILKNLVSKLGRFPSEP